MFWILYGICALGAGGLLIVLWMVAVEPRLFRVRRVVLDAGSLGLPELRILHLTDTHFHGRDEAILSFLKKLSAREEFDLVFFTGDLLDSPRGLESAARAAALFQPRLGTFAVLGGHDYAQTGTLETRERLPHRSRLQALTNGGPAGELVQRLTEQGVRVIEDANAQLLTGSGERLAVIGLCDVYVFDPDYEAAWDGVPRDIPAVAIAHSPDALPEACKRGVRLAFFGHTHGGQVRLPLVGAVVTKSKLPTRLARGAFRTGQTVFIISSGLGTARATPYRLLCRPEVTVAELTRSAPGKTLTHLKDAGLSA